MRCCQWQKKQHHRVRLNLGFRSDLLWWAMFLSTWNGSSMMSQTVRSHYTATITSDASGSWGCGAFTSSGKWFQFEWPGPRREVHITVKEFLPIVVAFAIWGSKWSGHPVRCLCNNAAVVAIVNSGASKSVTRQCT